MLGTSLQPPGRWGPKQGGGLMGMKPELGEVAAFKLQSKRNSAGKGGGL